MNGMNEDQDSYADELDISNVLQNTFVPDENVENKEPVTHFNDLAENNIGKPWVSLHYYFLSLTLL